IFLCCGDCDWSRYVRSDDGLLARRMAGPIHRNQTTIGNRADDARKRLAQWHAGAVAWVEHRLSAILGARAHQLRHSFADFGRSQPSSIVRGMEYAATDGCDAPLLTRIRPDATDADVIYRVCRDCRKRASVAAASSM